VIPRAGDRFRVPACLLLSIVLGAGTARAQAQPAAGSPGCTDSPEHRQLNLWVGEWEVTDDGAAIATSTMKRDVEERIRGGVRG
jgi:hypothetical protein